MRGLFNLGGVLLFAPSKGNDQKRLGAIDHLTPGEGGVCRVGGKREKTDASLLWEKERAALHLAPKRGKGERREIIQIQKRGPPVRLDGEGELREKRAFSQHKKEGKRKNGAINHPRQKREGGEHRGKRISLRSRRRGLHR